MRCAMSEAEVMEVGKSELGSWKSKVRSRKSSPNYRSCSGDHPLTKNSEDSGYEIGLGIDERNISLSTRQNEAFDCTLFSAEKLLS